MAPGKRWGSANLGSPPAEAHGGPGPAKETILDFERFSIL